MFKGNFFLLKKLFFQRIEFLTINYIDKLELVSKIDETKFKSIVNSRKEDNKLKKQQVQKVKAEEGKFYFSFF